jgi:hypothetical protein
MGRIEKGFDWLGYRISPAGLTLATKTLKNFVARVRQLYEREPRAATAAYRLGVYVRRWFRWMLAGFKLNVDLTPMLCGITNNVTLTPISMGSDRFQEEIAWVLGLPGAAR